MRRDVLGVDLQRLVEEPHGALLVASAAEHLAFDLTSFGRASVGGDRLVNQLVSLGWLGSGQEPRQLYLWTDGAGIELDGLAQQRLGLGLIAQTRSRGSQRGPELALEDRIAVAWLHQFRERGKFFLAKQGVCQHRQVIGIIAIALTGGSRLALGRWGIAELQIHFGKTGTRNGILGRIADRVAQLDLGGLEIALRYISFCLLDISGRLFSVCGRPGERGNSTGDNYAAPPTAPLTPRHWLSFYPADGHNASGPIWRCCIGS